jgi:hypothetical protein
MIHIALVRSFGATDMIAQAITLQKKTDGVEKMTGN